MRCMGNLGAAPPVFDARLVAADGGVKLELTTPQHGQNLHDALGDGLGRRLQGKELQQLARDLGAKVALCADAGVAYVDFKPANVVVDWCDARLDARLIDWDARFVTSLPQDDALGLDAFGRGRCVCRRD